MNIKQAAEQSGVSSPNIRFYEKEGLMTPARNRGNAYRDYTAEDIRTLKLIRMLRMLDMPLPVIQRVLNGEQPLSEALLRHSRRYWSSRRHSWRVRSAFAQS